MRRLIAICFALMFGIAAVAGPGSGRSSQHAGPTATPPKKPIANMSMHGDVGMNTDSNDKDPSKGVGNSIKNIRPTQGL